MTIRTLLPFLVGSRAAIASIASSRWSLAIGLLLVFSGGFARYYDSAYIAAEWSVLLRGPGVSIINSTVLFIIAILFARGGKGLPDAPRRYVAFVGIFWMTAPMAWMYAIPYERFLSPLGAIHANTWTLGLVSLWRVLLITRVLSILLGVGFWAMLFPVLMFSDIAIYIASLLAPQPVVDLMGGMQLTEIEREISSSAFEVLIGSMLAAPVLVIATIVARFLVKEVPPLAFQKSDPAPRGLLIFSALALLLWIPVLAITQPEQRLRHRAESLLLQGKVGEALAEMSAHQRGEYPPVWDPPPRSLYGDRLPPMGEVRTAMEASWPASWVADIYLAKSWRKVPGSYLVGLIKGQFFTELEKATKQLSAHDANVVQFHVNHDERLTRWEKQALHDALAERRSKSPP